MIDKTIQACFYGITMIVLIPLIFLHDITITPIDAYATTDLTNGSTIVTDGSRAEVKANTSAAVAAASPLSAKPVLQEFSVPTGSRPHDVAPAPDGTIWYTSQATGELGTLDQNGVLWFTGQSGIYGRLDPKDGHMEIFKAPRGPGPYGISTTLDGTIYYASLAGSYIARLDLQTGAATVLEPPTADQGARRVWSDSQGRVWLSEWNAGQLAVFDPDLQTWNEWRLPGDNPLPYAVYVDDQDMVWVSDFATNALLRFDPFQESFKVFSIPSPEANVRQILGRPGEVWGAESGTDKLIVIKTSN